MGTHGGLHHHRSVHTDPRPQHLPTTESSRCQEGLAGLWARDPQPKGDSPSRCWETQLPFPAEGVTNLCLCFFWKQNPLKGLFSP